MFLYKRHTLLPYCNTLPLLSVDTRISIPENVRMKIYIALLSVLLTACVGGSSAYLSPDVQRVNTETGEVQTITNARELEGGIIKAFPDIPIPSSHRIDLERSVIFTSPSQTVGKIALQGKGDVDSLFRFFETQMTTNGWSMVNAFQSSTSSLYFAKPGRFVAIIIEAMSQGSSRVTINIGPE